MGLPVEEATLAFGDVAFVGRGEGGNPLAVGLEHKKLPDLVQSLGNDRLAGHQLPGMLATYDRCYLVIEGEWDTDPGGRIVVPSKWKRGAGSPLKGAPPAITLMQRVMTLETRGGLRVHWSASQKASVRYICALYRFWTDRALDSHRSHLAIHAPDFDNSLLTPVSDFRRVVAQIPNVGFKTSAAVEQVFGGSLRRMMFATEEEWAAITTVDDKGKPRRIGAARAKKILEALK